MTVWKEDIISNPNVISGYVYRLPDFGPVRENGVRAWQVDDEFARKYFPLMWRLKQLNTFERIICITLYLQDKKLI